MFKAPLFALVRAEPALERLAELRLPIKVAYHISKLRRLMQAETRLFEEQRIASIKELGVPSADGGITVTPENGPEFQRRIKELGELEVEIPWGKLELSRLGEVAISAADLELLEPVTVPFAEEAPPDAG